MDNNIYNDKVLTEKETATVKKLNRIENILIIFSFIIFAISLTLYVTFIIFIVSLIACFYVYNKIKKIYKNAPTTKEIKIAAIKENVESAYKLFCEKRNITKTNCIQNDISFCVSNNTMHLTETFESYIEHYILEDGDPSIKLLPVKHTAIPVSDIQYFTKEGDVQYTSKISGGGGGGSSLSGAIVGGLIAGDAGAIIGSRKKINEIKTETQTIDSRKTVIRYYKEGAIKTLSFDGYEVYDYLLKKIPQKDLVTIQLSQGAQNIAPKLNSGTDIKKKLVDLKELHDSGLINDEEYETKRRELLSRI